MQLDAQLLISLARAPYFHRKYGNWTLMIIWSYSAGSD
jgi:hypothetical protein